MANKFGTREGFDLHQFHASALDVVTLSNEKIGGGPSAWALGNASTAFRDPRLSSSIPLFPVSWASDDPDGLCSAIRTAFDATSAKVKKVCSLRREYLTTSSKSLPYPVDKGGRFLVCEPSLTMNDDISGSYTSGFFDEFDVPPWDLWVAYLVDEAALRDCADDTAHSSARIDFLIAYVPAILVPLVNQGIWANTAACVYWLDQTQDQWCDLLKMAAGAAAEFSRLQQ
jgi:hypothetical protein